MFLKEEQKLKILSNYFVTIFMRKHQTSNRVVKDLMNLLQLDFKIF